MNETKVVILEIAAERSAGYWEVRPSGIKLIIYEKQIKKTNVAGACEKKFVTSLNRRFV